MIHWLYITFAILLLWAECSSRIDTRNIFKKVGLCLIILSCMIEFNGIENELLEWGAMLYIVADLWRKIKESWQTT